MQRKFDILLNNEKRRENNDLEQIRSDITSASARIHLILLSGDPQLILEQHRLLANAEESAVIKLDERAIVRVREMLRLMKGTPRNSSVCFGCKDIALQRYQFVLKSYLLFANASSRFIVDERGKYIRTSLISYLVLDVPRFLLELVASCVVLLTTAVRLVLLRQTIRKNQ